MRITDACEVDEPATVIVMKRYANRLVELAKRATPEVAKEARAEAKACDELYDKVEEMDAEVRELGLDASDLPDASAQDPGLSVSAHLRALRNVYDAVEDVQAQALTRELDLIKEMSRAGKLDPDHARALRNDVYIQQLTL